MSEQITSLMHNLKLIGGDVCFEKTFKKETAEDSTLIPEAALTRVEDKFLGMLIIEASNNRKYGEMKRSLHNSMAEGHNRYPPNKATAYTMISKFVPERNQESNRSSVHNSPATGVLFYQRAASIQGAPVVGTNKVLETSIECWCCGRKGHRSPVYPLIYSGDNNTGFQGMQYMFTQGAYDIEEFTQATSILIDTGSTFNSVCNADLLHNVVPCVGI